MGDKYVPISKSGLDIGRAMREGRRVDVSPRLGGAEVEEEFVGPPVPKSVPKESVRPRKTKQQRASEALGERAAAKRQTAIPESAAGLGVIESSSEGDAWNQLLLRTTPRRKVRHPLEPSAKQMRSDIAGTFSPMRAGVGSEYAAAAAGKMAEADSYGRVHGALTAFDEKMFDMQQKQAQRAEDEMDIQRDILRQQRELTSELISMQKYDPRSFWKDQPAGMKFLAAVSSLAMGLAKGASIALGGGGAGIDPTSHITDAIDRNLQAHQQAMSDVKINLGALGQGMTASQSVYENLVNKMGDERSAYLMMRASLIELAQVQIQEISARATGGMLDAKGQQAMQALIQEQAKTTDQLNLHVYNRRPRMVGGGPALRGPIRKTVERLAGESFEREGEYRKQYFDMAQKNMAQLGDTVTMAGPDGQVQISKEEQKKIFSLSENRQVQAAVLAIGAISRFKSRYGNDIPGMGKSGWLAMLYAKLPTLTQSTDEANQLLRDAVFTKVFAQSGAQVSMPELERRTDTMLGEMRSEDSVNNFFNEWEAQVNDTISFAEAGLSEAGRSVLRNVTRKALRNRESVVTKSGAGMYKDFE